jgi:hypothetical protein
VSRCPAAPGKPFIVLDNFAPKQPAESFGIFRLFAVKGEDDVAWTQACCTERLVFGNINYFCAGLVLFELDSYLGRVKELNAAKRIWLVFLYLRTGRNFHALTQMNATRCDDLAVIDRSRLTHNVAAGPPDGGGERVQDAAGAHETQGKSRACV